MMSLRRLIDIGANLTDPMFLGIYNGTKKHEPDLELVKERAWNVGLEKIIITGGSLDDSKKALELATSDSKLYSTAGCHPTRCSEFEEDPDSYYQNLLRLVKENRSKIVAIGECGLDYDRLHFCGKDIQKIFFKKQLSLSLETNLPLFLHCRNAADDLLQELGNFPELVGGVVHSFDGSKEEAEQILNKGFSIGINGCSLKTENNLEVVKHIPIEKLMIETDAPWCEIRPSHASFKYVKTTFPSVKKEKWQKTLMVKSRNEPANIVQVLEVVSAIKCVDIDKLCQHVFNNTMKIFFPNC